MKKGSRQQIIKATRAEQSVCLPLCLFRDALMPLSLMPSSEGLP